MRTYYITLRRQTGSISRHQLPGSSGTIDSESFPAQSIKLFVISMHKKLDGLT
jgi:hypothetical protein